MKRIVKAGLTALSLSGVFGTVAMAQSSLADLPFMPDSVNRILESRGITFDSLEFEEPELRDRLGASHCYQNPDGSAATHPSGALIQGDDNLYALVIVTGNRREDVTLHNGVTREQAYELMQQERSASGLLQNEEGRIVRVYSISNGIERVARPGAIHPTGQSSTAVLCADLITSGVTSPTPGGTR